MASSPPIVLMHRLYDLLGRWLFPRQQSWQQRKSARTLVLTVAFTLAIGLVMAEAIRLRVRLNNQIFNSA